MTPATVGHPPSRRATVLLGGGIDSTALVAFMQEQGFAVAGLHYDYGQPAVEQEKQAVSRVAAHFGIPVKHKSLGQVLRRNGEEFVGRNAALVLDALSEADRPSVIALGIHAGTGFYDCSPEFLRGVNALVIGYSGGQVQVIAPWVTAAKADIVQFARERNLPLHLTYSCQGGRSEACGSCLSCRDREELAC